MAEMYQAAFEQAMIGMALVAPDGRWLRVNRAICDLLGYSETELLAAGFRPLIERDPQASGGDGLARLLTGTGEAYETEQDFTDGQGRRLWIHLHISLVRDSADAPNYLIVQVRDVTATRLAEQERVVALAQLSRSNQELERFASVASHDLQEPLRKIQAFGNRLLALEETRLSERGQDYLGRMQQAALRMQDLIDGLLAYSRVSNRPLDAVPTNLELLVRDVLRDLEGQLVRTGGQIEVGALPTVMGDQLRLRQLFQNLISNALKFHRPDVSPLITITAARSPLHRSEGGDVAAPYWRIAVADNGIGFDEQYRERIFGMFQRLHGRTEFDGSGIGLALCRQIVERHGGSIIAESSPGAGATFVVTLPAGENQGGEYDRTTPANHDPAGG